ncbi:MAG TPA: DUF488 domain-containing protein [Gammaproteobacteria bacterium]|nr:DUF488 domain-containing protein [Gammaproteobacteria bacterium]
MPEKFVLTIGHSTRSFDELVALLKAHKVAHLVDVRTVPRSRRNPQFNRETLGDSLKGEDIAYTHQESLGGLRNTRRDSPNMGWRNASFRGYADYMQTDEFAAAMDELVALAERERTAIMCAEAVPWRCHRSMIADALVVRGFSVEHILSGERTMLHALTDFAVFEGDRIRYPAPNRTSDLFSEGT